MKRKYLLDYLKNLPFGREAFYTLGGPAVLIQKSSGDIYPLIKKPGAPFTNMITVGRSANNDIVIRDNHVSRFHAFLRSRRHNFVVCDAGSMHGTFLNNIALEARKEVEIASGDFIRFGDVIFRFYGITELYELFLVVNDVFKAMISDAIKAETQGINIPSVQPLPFASDAVKAMYTQYPEALLLAIDMRSPILIALGVKQGSPNRNRGTYNSEELFPDISQNNYPFFFIVRPSSDGTDLRGAAQNLLVTIGSSPHCDIFIGHSSVSKMQATISFDNTNQCYHVVDEYSSNCTRINQKTLTPGEPTPINSGDILSFGKFRCVFLDPPTLRETASEDAP